MNISLPAIATCCIALAACDRSAPKSSAGTNPLGANSASAPSTASAGGNADPGACPRTGLWSRCSVENRLQRAGFVLQEVPGPPRRRAGFSVLPTAYVLNRSRLEVFIYPDASSLERDLATIDTLTASPVGTLSQWRAPVAWVRSGNLAAVFLTDNSTRADRLTLALTAGAPQP